MNNKEIIAGLDIGTANIKVMIGEIDSENGHVNIIGYGQTPSRGLNKGDIVDIESVAQCINTATEYAERMAGVEVERFYIALPIQHISIIHNSGAVAIGGEDRVVKEEDVDRVLNSAKVVAISPEKRIIDIIPKQFRIDNKSGVLRPVGMAGVRLEVDAMLVAINRAVEQNIVNCIETAGYEIFHFILNPVAAGHHVLTKDDKEVGVILIDFGAGTTEISYFKDGALQKIANIPMGGLEMTGDIATVLKIPQRKAEELKLSYGNLEGDLHSEDGENEIDYSLLNDVLEARFNEIVNLLIDEIVAMNFKEAPPAGVVAIGGVANIPGFIELLEESLYVPVRSGHVKNEDHIYINCRGLINYSYDNNLFMGFFENRERKRGRGVSGIWRWFKDLFEMS